MKASTSVCLFFFTQVVIDKHPVRFFVHKRPHVDFFLEVVSVYPFSCVCVLALLHGLAAPRPVCAHAGEPVVRAGSFYGQYGDLRLGGGGQTGQQQEHLKT